MDAYTIQTILQNALEKHIPASEVNLWPAVQAEIEARESQESKQARVIKFERVHSFAYLIMVLVALLIAAMMTPQGRSFAQSVLHFFTPAESTTFPLLPSQIITAELDASATAQAPAPLVSVAEAEAKAGFKAAELPFVPEGFIYLGARLYGETISIEYQIQGGGGNLILQQSQGGYIQSDWDKVPANEIVPVKIGELDGEFAQGSFVVYPEETLATWNPEAPILRLRWVDEDIWFQLTKFGNVEAIEYLDQERLVGLAEHLIRAP
jgi:hypothetical protein